jgi:ATPase subunit of ABC transporter with duplicated ATPase domains
MNPALNVKELSYGFSPQETIIEHLNFTLPFGSILIIKGRNGCGKSTLLRLLLGRRKHLMGGSIVVHSKTMAFLPQVFHTPFHIACTLKEIIQSGRPSIDLAKIALFSQLHLDTIWQNASGGERQKTMLLRTFVAQPDLLLLDEPTNHLDKTSSDRFWQGLEEYILKSPERRSAIVVCHSDDRPILEKSQTHFLDLNRFLAKE